MQTTRYAGISAITTLATMATVIAMSVLGVSGSAFADPTPTPTPVAGATSLKVQQAHHAKAEDAGHQPAPIVHSPTLNKSAGLTTDSATLNTDFAQTVTVDGHIYLGSTGTPAPSVIVLFCEVDTNDTLGGECYSGVTNSSGEIALDAEDPNTPVTLPANIDYQMKLQNLANVHFQITMNVPPTSGTTCVIDANDGCTFSATTTAVTGLDAVLPAAATLSGTVTADGGAALPGVTVYLDQEISGDFTDYEQVTTGVDGSYSFGGIVAGDYAIEYIGDDSYAYQSFDDESEFYQPDIYTLAASDNVTGVNAVLHAASSISGTVTAPAGSAADFESGDVTAEVEVFDGPSQTWVETGYVVPVTPSAGTESYSFEGLAPDDYRILFDYEGTSFTGTTLSSVIHVAPGSSVSYNATILSHSVPQPQGSFDSAVGVPGGIQISGWSLDLSTSASTYVWVNVDGSGGPMQANVSLPWINSLFPGEGANHGFAGNLAASPGKHTVCVYGTSSLALGCKTVTVPQNAQGSFDSASGVVGGIQISGWSLDLSTPSSTYVWVNVDGSGGPMQANVSLPWINSLFPGEGANHGFAGTLSSTPGKHTVCVYGTNSLPLGCKVVTVPQNAQGSFDSATGVIGGVQVSGWSLDLSTSASTYIWVNVDGSGGPMIASASLPWINALFPGEGADHGFVGTVPASPGKHVVCVYGTNSIPFGCKTVTVPQNAAGSFDTATAVAGGIQVAGWSLDLTTSASTYIWVNVDGIGGPMLANVSLPWINALYPGEGVNHGFAGTVAAKVGKHTVCVYGTNSLALGCKVVTVTAG